MYCNLDGIQATPQVPRYVDYLRHQGYSKEIQLRGTVGFSELGLWTGTASKVGIVAFVRPSRENYAYVLLADGTMTDGCFHRFDDGRFGLS